MSNSKAFTLIEVIVALVVVTIIGFAAWEAVNVLSPASNAMRLRIKAEHLITLSQEELHQYAQNRTNFDTTLNTCNFEPNNNCGFADVSLQFPEYTRTLTWIPADSTSGLKKFDIHVSWPELGNTQQLDSVILLVRPPNPLPGNIYGLVTSAQGGAILDKVQVLVQNLGTSQTQNITFSQAGLISRPDGNRANYTFAQPNTGYFVLPAGNWQLTANVAGYEPFTYPQNIMINGSDEREVDFQMTPLLTPATISGSLLNVNAGGPQPNFYNGSIIQLDQAGSTPSNVSPVTSNGSGFNFTVTFTDPNQQCFTLSTLRAYQSNWAGNFTCNGFSLQANGWSSAVANFDNSVLNCAANWQGDPTTDRICVKPGDNLTNQNISLAPVPTATITALVTDLAGNPINATPAFPVSLAVYWHDGTFYNFQTYTSSDGAGHYSITAPAEQDLFPNGDNALISARAQVPVGVCCNNTGSITRYSPTKGVGPLPPDQAVTLAINTVVVNQQCGNADGGVVDAKTGAALSGATVTVSGHSQATAGGDYIFQCSPAAPPYDLNAGQSTIAATDNGYYPFTSLGNAFYSPSAPADIVANQVNNLNTMGLWPIGYSSISGKVVEEDQGSQVPLSGVTVTLNLGTGGTPLTAVSADDGSFTFDNVPETWPPPALVGNPLYNQTPLDHTLTVAATPSYQAYNSGAFTLTAGTPYTTTIVLVPNGGV